MSVSDPTVLCSVLSNFDSFVSARGSSGGHLLAMEGLSSGDIADPAGRISLNKVARLFERAAKIVDDPCFGLHYAEEFPRGGTGHLGQMLLSAPTVGEALESAVRFIELLMQPVEVIVQRSRHEHLFRINYSPELTAPHAQYTGFILAGLVLRLRLGAGHSWTPDAMGFAHRAPGHGLREYRRLFGSGLSFDERHYEVVIDTETMSKPMPKIMERLYQTLREAGERKLEERRMLQGVRGRLQSAIARRLDDGEPVDLGALADELELSTRALQWRLEQAGTSYELQLMRTRKLLAVRLLRDTDLSVGQIAQRLGYAETSAFTRACDKWFGETPSRHRRTLRGDQPG